MLQLRRRSSDRFFNRRATDRVANAVAEVRERAGEVGERGQQMARSAFDYAMNHRKATSAVVLGTAVAAGLLWFMQRNGGYNAVRRQVLQRVRGNGSRRSRQSTSQATE